MEPALRFGKYEITFNQRFKAMIIGFQPSLYMRIFVHEQFSQLCLPSSAAFHV